MSNAHSLPADIEKKITETKGTKLVKEAEEEEDE
jgi:hypothetical protein